MREKERKNRGIWQLKALLFKQWFHQAIKLVNIRSSGGGGSRLNIVKGLSHLSQIFEILFISHSEYRGVKNCREFYFNFVKNRLREYIPKRQATRRITNKRASIFGPKGAMQLGVQLVIQRKKKAEKNQREETTLDKLIDVFEEINGVFDARVHNIPV